MANRELFATCRVQPITDTANAAGGSAYAFGPKHTLAQLAATGCFNDTFYASAAEQLLTVLQACEKVDAEFMAKTAIYARERGMMKDMPAFLCAALSIRSPELFEKVFPRVVDTGRMLRTFVQMIRSGVCGRKSLGTRPKRMIQRWFAERADDEVFYTAIGNNPSFADIIRLAHPRPETPERAALYKWLLGDKRCVDTLPEKARHFIAWKRRRQTPGFDPMVDAVELPDAPFLLLKGCTLSTRELRMLVPRLSWTALRLNIASLARRGVFQDAEVAALAARRLADRTEIARAKAFPHQAFQTAMALYADEKEEKAPPATAWGRLREAIRMVHSREEEATDVPAILKRAAVDALETTLDNAPIFEGKKVYILIDVSGSMSSPVTGRRRGATTATRCVDAAALLAMAIWRKNPESRIIPFSDQVRNFTCRHGKSVFTGARELAALCNGGTDISAPMRYLNSRSARGDLVIYISDNESWMDSNGGAYHRCSATLEAWHEFRRRNPGARMACMDLQPSRDTQTPDGDYIINIGGFSDAVFERLNAFVGGDDPPAHWVRAIESITL